ncbi:hypothetical protein Goari_026712 [Gossypium aridum]|uniref:FBD domain-containing protein n=1 Tax=Gossypium aridum TaxID=34290 RepID=A0A7J8XD26_GOSAI|nr:hypothetical protein [Gossypium aridum]
MYCSVANASELNIQSPSLKELTLYFDPPDIDHSVVINAPNLVYFRYGGDIDRVYPLGNMKSLEKAQIYIWFGSETNAAHLYQGICNNYAGTQWKALCIEIPSCLSFHLKEIEIEIPRIDTLMIEVVSYFLDNAMVLERLIISMNWLTAIEKRKARNQLLQLLKSSKKCLIMIL